MNAYDTEWWLLILFPALYPCSTSVKHFFLYFIASTLVSKIIVSSWYFSWILFLQLHKCSCKSAQLCYSGQHLEPLQGKESSCELEIALEEEVNPSVWGATQYCSEEAIKKLRVMNKTACLCRSSLHLHHKTQNCSNQLLPRSGTNDGLSDRSVG